MTEPDAGLDLELGGVPITGPGAGSWLVVIDMQNVFADPDSYWATPGFADLVPTIRELVAQYAPRVVFTRFVGPAEPRGSWQGYYLDWPDALTPADDPQYAIVDGLADLVTDDVAVISRTTFGKWDDELAGLVGPGAELVLAGVSTDCCVLSTALAAADAGAWVIVAAEACAGASQEDHDRAIAAMRLYAPLITVR